MSIPIIDTLSSLGSFPVVDSSEVQAGSVRLDVALNNKADKTYVDTELAKKANTSDISAKADKTYVDTELAKKANISDISSKADKTYVDTELANKVDKETGKGLSTNDYTTADKDKLSTVASGATKVIVDTDLNVSSNNAVSNKVVTNAFASKVDNTTFNSFKTSNTAIINAKSDKTYVDTELADKADSKDVVSNDNMQEIAIAGFFNTTTNNTTDFYITSDGKKFKKITSISTVYQTDGDMIFVNGTFYYACKCYNDVDTVRILTSKDLVNWEEHYFTFKSDVEGTNIGYGEKWFIDCDKIYLVYGQIITNTPKRQIRPYIVECTDIENLTFGTARPITLNNNNVIDPMIIKKGSEYFLFCKKEDDEGSNKNGNIEIWKSSDLTNWTVITLAISSLSNYKYEGPFVNYQNGKYYLYVDNWGATHFHGIEVCESTDLINWSAPVRAASEKIMRHGFCRTIADKRAMQIINNYVLHEYCYEPDKNVIYVHAQDKAGSNVYSKLFSFTVYTGDSAGNVNFNVKDIQVNYYDSECKLEYKKSGETINVVLYEMYRRQNSLINSNEVRMYYTVSDDTVNNSKIITVLIRNDKTWATPCLSIIDVEKNGTSEFKVHSVNEFVEYDASSFVKPKFPPLPYKKLNFDISSSLVESGSVTADIVGEKFITFNFNAIKLKTDCDPWSLKWMFTIGEKNVVNTHFCPMVATMSGKPVLVKFRNDDINFIAELSVGGESLSAGDVITGTCTIPFEYTQ